MTEQSLHKQLKQWYAREGGDVEAWIGDYQVDVVQDNLLTEIQTGSFSAIKPKLRRLVKEHRVRLVYPVMHHKWIIRLGPDGERVARRKSPKRGSSMEVFRQLVYIPDLCKEPNFMVEVALVNAEEYWIDDSKGSWRRKRWSIHDRKLLHVQETHRFTSPLDYLTLLPPSLNPEFTTGELAKQAGLRVSLARKMAYTLRQMDALEVCGKRGRSNLYRVKPMSPDS